jgi:hypothetical protein
LENNVNGRICAREKGAIAAASLTVTPERLRVSHRPITEAKHARQQAKATVGN